MPIFQFKQIVRVERIITVHADNEIQAEARATVGGINHIRQREGVEVSHGIEYRDTVRIDDCSHCATCGESLTLDDNTLWPVCNVCDCRSCGGSGCAESELYEGLVDCPHCKGNNDYASDS